MIIITITVLILDCLQAPGFAYAWLEVVSHRVFIGRILSLTPQQKGWPMYAQLLTALFKFLSPFLRNAELAKPVRRSDLINLSLSLICITLHQIVPRNTACPPGPAP